MEALIAAGADVNRPDAFGMLPLVLALDGELDFRRQAGTPLDLRLVRPLLHPGADPDVADENGDSARTFALKNGHHAAIEPMDSLR